MRAAGTFECFGVEEAAAQTRARINIEEFPTSQLFSAEGSNGGGMYVVSPENSNHIAPDGQRFPAEAHRYFERHSEIPVPGSPTATMNSQDASISPSTKIVAARFTCHP
jgi:hypothetical protein